MLKYKWSYFQILSQNTGTQSEIAELFPALYRHNNPLLLKLHWRKWASIQRHPAEPVAPVPHARFADLQPVKIVPVRPLAVTNDLKAERERTHGGSKHSRRPI